MYKQRDNECHPPMTSDPSGSGIVSSAIPTTQNDMSAFTGPAVAAGSRKRGRDIRGLERFRTVVYGEDGFRQLHAMVMRNPVLMYPPGGIDEARARVTVAARQRELQELQQLHASGAGEGEEDVFALFEERRVADHREDTLPEGASAGPSAQTPQTFPSSPSLAALRQDEELARTHHKQLDSFLRLLYEFNHVSFVKLPMEDTLQLLSRCGKEAVAHIMEYETQVRLKRQARLRELTALQEEKKALAKRRTAADDAEQARLLAAAEYRQAKLDFLGLDHAPDSLEQRENVDTNNENHDVRERRAAPQVRFALDEKVKVEEEEKDTGLVETVMSGVDV